MSKIFDGLDTHTAIKVGNFYIVQLAHYHSYMVTITAGFGVKRAIEFWNDVT